METTQYPAENVGLWLMAIRPKTLPASVAPILMGWAMAFGDGRFHPFMAVICLLTALALQIGANLANDYFDGVRGVDGAGRLGPARVTQACLIAPRAVKIAFIAAFAVAAAGWLTIAFRAGWPIIACGAAAIAAGILYTGGPRPYGARALGELAVFVFFGPAAVAGCYYAQALRLPMAPVVAGCAAGLISAAILTVNNLRDIESDRAAGRRTLAVRAGAGITRWQYVACMASALLIPLLMALSWPQRSGVAISALTALSAAGVARTVLRSSDGPRLNKALADTGKILLLFCVLFSIGWNL